MVKGTRPKTADEEPGDIGGGYGDGGYGITGDEARLNRYPSDSDWSFAEYLVNHGAGGAQGAAGFAMYIIDTTGNLREFEYSDRSTYEGLSLANKTKLSGTDLPPVMQSDGTSCG